MNVQQKLTLCSRRPRSPRTWRRLERLLVLRVPLRRWVYQPTAPTPGTDPAAACRTTRPRRRSIIVCETARGALSCTEDVWTGQTSPTGTEMQSGFYFLSNNVDSSLLRSLFETEHRFWLISESWPQKRSSSSLLLLLTCVASGIFGDIFSHERALLTCFDRVKVPWVETCPHEQSGS